MKSCPKCNIDYADKTLEFCLEDGFRLILKNNEKLTNAKTAMLSNYQNLPFSESENSKETILQNKTTNKFENIKEKATTQGIKIIEISPIVFSLTHNYWQWLYLNKTNFYDTIGFLTSSNFIVWLVLLISGSISGFVALKFGKNKGFAITGLVILAINLLLSIVPNR